LVEKERCPDETRERGAAKNSGVAAIALPQA